MRLSHLVLGVILMVATGLGSADAQNAAGGSVYRISYFEAAAPEVAATAKLARESAAAGREAPGNLAFAAFQEVGRPSRFALLNAWRDKTAAEAHDAAAATAAFRGKLAPILVGPLEIRSFGGFSLAAPGAAGGARAVFVLTHVDVFPAGKDQAAALVSALAEAGRKMPGNLRFDVLQVGGHANHFTLVEGWRGRRSFEASLMAAPTKDFRQKVTPLEGALYDERLYRELR
jgi:quinol monooxygenase YgiN